jgi:demethylmenaquinone methyltransferase / 2-methoxy-6-polyprenyl-1,4-benzoquinol methylase
MSSHTTPNTSPKTNTLPTSNNNPEYIKNLFGSISGTYDKANDVITLGIARQWRKQLVELSKAREGHWVLDCATGTGDLALEFKKAVGATGKVIGLDFCKEMLESAPGKAKKQNLDVTFELGDVLALNYPDKKFDVTSIAYGIRNVADVQKAVSEMARVTKSGGKVMILETGDVDNRVLQKAIRFYFEKVVPTLGGWVSGKPEAYQYLQTSSGQFLSGEHFCEALSATGLFSQVTFTTLMGGASFIYRCDVK